MQCHIHSVLMNVHKTKKTYENPTGVKSTCCPHLRDWTHVALSVLMLISGIGILSGRDANKKCRTNVLGTLKKCSTKGPSPICWICSPPPPPPLLTTIIRVCRSENCHFLAKQWGTPSLKLPWIFIFSLSWVTPRVIFLFEISSSNLLVAI